MNLSRYKITINPQGLTGAAAATYSSKVREHLRWIERTKTGKILLNSIKFHGKEIVISPYTGGDCNALGGGVTVNGGIQGYVNYSPDTFSLHGACSATKSVSNRGLYWDEMLFHELVHAFRNVSGKWHQPTLSYGLHRYTDNEEFIALLLSNIYISDKSNKIKSGLRADHIGFEPLSRDFDDSFKFFSTSTLTFGLIEKFCKDNPGLTRKIANDLANIQFNPLAAYYTNKEKARKLSQGATSRDVAGFLAHIQSFTNDIISRMTPAAR